LIFSALFFLDTGSKLWLWQGWWPENDSKSNADNFSENNQMNNITGSGIIRWHAERRAAMQTAVDYRRLTYGGGRRERIPEAKLVWAGAEPVEFTNLFPSWKHDEDVERLNIQVGHSNGKHIPRNCCNNLSCLLHFSL
jgi:supervillin